VIDCEGAIHPILQAYPSLLDGINTVIIENDFKSMDAKEAVDKAFVKAGLKLVHTVGHHYAPLKALAPIFYQVFQRPE
jgi:hypothetical protein